MSPNPSLTYSVVESPRLLSSVVFHHVHSLFWHAFPVCVCVCQRGREGVCVSACMCLVQICIRESVYRKPEVDCHLVAEIPNSLPEVNELKSKHV